MAAANHLTLAVSGTASPGARVRDALNASNWPTAGGRTPTYAPHAPADIAGDVEAVVGLDACHVPPAVARPSAGPHGSAPTW